MGNKDKKVILISGASSGMGKEAAKRLAEQGHQVYAAARRLGKMDDLKEYGIVTLALDLVKSEDNKKVVDLILDKEKKIDVLINNAGFGLYGAVEDIPLEAARYQFEVNLFGLADLTRQVLPSMRARKSGRIINTSSMGGKVYTSLGAWYHASKHALEGWSDCLRLELSDFGIDVVIIEPGIIKTNFFNVVAENALKYMKNSAYQKQLEPYQKMLNDPKKMEMGSDVSVIARVFVKAVNARRPKTRYVKGMMARPAIFMRQFFGDRIFDRLISRAFG